MRPPRENPFRVDRVSALPFAGVDLAPLIDRLLSLGHAAIVGPHGAGKSTLLRSIGDALRDRGHATVAVGLPGSATGIERSAALTSVHAAPPDVIVLLDGYEQFTWTERRAVRRRPRLIVTAHRPGRLPTLLTLRPTVATLETVLTRLGVAAGSPARAAARAAFARHRGDVRATLMTLYDAWAAGEDF